MNSQNFKNHARFSPVYHFFAIPLSLIVLIGTIVNVVKSSEENFYSATLLVMVVLLLILAILFARTFALKAQDRAIRAEENLRHFVLSGKPLDSNLTTRQIIGLRFASDEEFPDLAKKAVADKLSEKEIKELVKNWRGDYYRI
ncbi:hypothetical protein JBL43_03270 [Aureibaculum sp. A20]|uniref:Uncharacterized protein n=1 Tax=Aureibaculum flavum TaxID=2795986 RepID=A0ABS0WMP4_9FLAO|nr:DUF6526 family protein [Aureibaculum flavum]MBJ2173240.1 hypothetical protein [Aureibaculum flavum]